MKQPKISIVVPVYKAEKFLHRCVRSILEQTFEDFELILVNDGSPDASGVICDEFANADSRVRVFHIANSGANRARALGVAKSAQCEYVTFVDSDDSLPPTALQELYDLTGEKYDIVIGSYNRNPNQYADCEMDKLELAREICHYNIASSPYAKLFRKELFDDTTFDLPRDFVVGEDLIMNLRLTFACQRRIRVSPTIVYYYDDNMDGIMNTFNYTLEYIEKSYKLKKEAIPEEYRMQCMPACIENIMAFTHLIMGYYWHHRSSEKTAFHQLLTDDMMRYAVRPRSVEAVVLQYANPVVGALYLSYYHAVRMLKKLKKWITTPTAFKV